MFKYTLDNFRSYNNQEFDFKRINILIGENSGGKSSLIKSLLVLKQTLENPDNSNLILNGKYADLGNYKETIKNHDENHSLSFKFSFQDDLPSFVNFFIFTGEDEIKEERRKKIEAFLEKALEFETTIKFTIPSSLEKHSSIKTELFNEYLGSLEIIFPEKKKDIEENNYELVARSSICTILYKNFTRNKTFEFKDIEFSKKGFMSFIDSPSLRKECEKYDDGSESEESLFYEMVLFLVNQNLIEYYIKQIKYLNPLSSNPKRIYINKDSQSQYDNSDLEKFTNLITTKQISNQTISKFDEILKEYGIADGIKVISSENLPVSELRVKIKNLVSNIFDVGYGVSLQIPMLFEALVAEQEHGATFVIEQPEVHLHPKLQAKFIETLLKLGEKNKYIIETHSEHIVRMLQVITKNELYDVTNEKIQILYFIRGSDSFEISQHDLDSKGKMIEPFPSGFFDTSYNLTKKLMF
jgi:predicted ATPase